MVWTPSPISSMFSQKLAWKTKTKNGMKKKKKEWEEKLFQSLQSSLCWRSPSSLRERSHPNPGRVAPSCSKLPFLLFCVLKLFARLQQNKAALCKDWQCLLRSAKSPIRARIEYT
jgi:hypothetical protein